MALRKIVRIGYSSHFVRALKKLSPELLQIIIERERIFRQNCFDPRLKTHKLHGEFREWWSFSLTQSHRVVFVFLDANTVDFLNVGDHSIYE